MATPIGNLADITFRAVDILRGVDLILCEDTRQTQKLLNHYNIRAKTQSYHQHSKLSKQKLILDELRAGKNLALVSDAGTPGISDPGNKLIEYLFREYPNLKIIPIPGPSAVTAALSVSGFPADKFKFLGFMPHKKGREKLFKEIAEAKKTVVFYESTHRIIKTLGQLEVFLNKDRQIVVCRELTKMFESVYRGNVQEVLEKLLSGKVKGEFVVVIRGG